MGDLSLYNTLTRRQEAFQPLEPGHVRMYCCGPTVYNFIHIGNLRTFLWGDLLRRYLEWKGYRVTMVMNLTDVEDKIIRNAMERGQDIQTYTAPYIDAFFQDLDTVRIRRADLYPKATDHIPEMIELVRRLDERGHTYVADDSVYFRIASLPGYGRLAQLELSTGPAMHRVEQDEYDKEDARDFVLWKARKEGEPSWDTPIGDGRPGWHLECSAMAMKYLGESFDIHTGAVDLIFPHHENEIAQSEGATGKPFVRFWIHGEHLNVEQQKMSKSVGNIYTLRELTDLGHDPVAIRYALLSVPHRTKLNFTLRSLEDAGAALTRIESFLLRLAAVSSEVAGDEGTALASRFLSEFEAAMDDDLNTAGGLGALFSLVRDVNTAIDARTIGAEGRDAILAAVQSVNRVFDVLPTEERSLDREIEELIRQRNEARASRDFATSDRIRDELAERGVVLEDTPDGVRWRRR